MKLFVRAALILGLICMTGCSVANGRDPHDLYASDPFKGKASAQIIAPDGSRTAEKESGTGSAQFVPLGNDRSRLIVQANILRTNDSGFIIEGSKSDSGWSGRSGALKLAIDGQGNISGGGIENQHRITIGGRVTGNRFNLMVETEKLAMVTGNTLPVGTRIVFDYDLGRRDVGSVRTGAAPTATPDDKSGNKCKRRVWRTRNVTTPGGGMTMIQVPHCVN